MCWMKRCFVLTGSASSLFGIVQETVDSTRPIAVSFSTSSHNRIAVENGAVEKVFGDSAIFSIAIDPMTGNAFVNVLKDIAEQPTTLSVVTSTGLVQDLQVTSNNGASEQVLLKEKEDLGRFSQEVSLASTIDVLNKIFEGKVPFGYGQTTSLEPLVLPSPLETESLTAFEGPFEIIKVYRITNRGSETVILTADALKKDNSCWAFLNVHELRQDEQALCLVGCPKDMCK